MASETEELLSEFESAVCAHVAAKDDYWRTNDDALTGSLEDRLDKAAERVKTARAAILRAPSESQGKTRIEADVRVIREQHNDGLGCNWRVRVTLIGEEHHALQTDRYEQDAAERIAARFRKLIHEGSPESGEDAGREG